MFLVVGITHIKPLVLGCFTQLHSLGQYDSLMQNWSSSSPLHYSDILRLCDALRETWLESALFLYCYTSYEIVPTCMPSNVYECDYFDL